MNNLYSNDSISNEKEPPEPNETAQNNEDQLKPAIDGMIRIYGIIGGIIAFIAIIIPWASYGDVFASYPAPSGYIPHESLSPLYSLIEGPFMMALSLAGLLFLVFLGTLLSSIIAFSCGLLYLVLSIYSFFRINAIADLLAHQSSYNHVSIEFGFFIGLIGTLLLTFSGIKGINNLFNQLSNK